MNLIFDIGGTFIKWAIFDDNKIITKGKNKTPSGDYLKNILQHVYLENNKKYNINNVGISTTGCVNPFLKTIIYSDTYIIKNYQGFNFNNIFLDKNNKDILKVVENDVNAAIFGEITNQKLENEKNIFMITLGTGIGGAFYLGNGKIFYGTNFKSCEVGKMIINNCVWEKNSSSIGFQNLVNEKIGSKLELRTLFENIENNEQYKQLINDWYKNLAFGIGNIILNWNPKTLLIGGGVTENKKFEINKIVDILHTKFSNFAINDTNIQKATLGNDAALVGINGLINY